jgi:hypothetical protein
MEVTEMNAAIDSPQIGDPDYTSIETSKARYFSRRSGLVTLFPFAAMERAELLGCER